MRARWTFAGMLFAVVGLIALPAGAWQLEPGDRGLLHSYSPEALELLWATIEAEEGSVCEIEEGEQYTYRTDDDEVIVLSGEDEILTDDCSLTATDVTGPQGQVNHGTVVSSFIRALKEAGHQGGIGCYVSAIARTDYGKGDQQIRTPDIEEESTDPIDEEDPTVEFTITATNCPPAESDEAEEETKGQPEWAQGRGGQGDSNDGAPGKGKPSWAGESGPPPHAKGGKR